jgi:hypothetical protein
MTSAKSTTSSTDGFSTREPSDWTSPTRIETIAAPLKLPSPPATTTMKAFRITSEPTVGYTETSGRSSPPARAARPEQTTKARMYTLGTGTPRAAAIGRFCATALSQMPYFVYFRPK